MAKSRGRKPGMKPSELAAHKPVGKVLQAPLNQLGGLHLSSWVNKVLPEMLWALLLLQALPRTECIEKFKNALKFVEENSAAFDKKTLGHSHLAEMDQHTFDATIGALGIDEGVKLALSPLLLLDGLPGKDRWGKLLPVPDKSKWDQITPMIADSYDHQSRKATDARWLRIMTEVYKGTIHVAPAMQEHFQKVVDYGDSGDYEKSGSSVRALEMMTRGAGTQPSTWATTFWELAFKVSSCILSKPDEDSELPSYEDYLDAVYEVYEQLANHFMQTIKTTHVDARHECSFGLVFYIMYLTLLAVNARVGQSVQGRLVLRSGIETAITLLFLAKKDDPTIWVQYRNARSS